MEGGGRKGRWESRETGDRQGTIYRGIEHLIAWSWPPVMTWPRIIRELGNGDADAI